MPSLRLSLGSHSQGQKGKPAHAHSKIQSLSACSFNPARTHQAFLSPLTQPCHHWHTHTRAEQQRHSRLPNWINALNGDRCLSCYWCHHDTLCAHRTHRSLRSASCPHPMAAQAAHMHTHANVRQNSLTQGSYSSTAQCHPHLLHVAPPLGSWGHTVVMGLLATTCQGRTAAGYQRTQHPQAFVFNAMTCQSLQHGHISALSPGSPMAVSALLCPYRSS